MVKIIRKETEHFTFYFDTAVPELWLDKLPGDSENRIVKMCRYTNMENAACQSKSKYFVKISNKCSGKYAEKIIACQAPENSELLYPFIHEEMHDFTYNHWGVLPCFWFEGIAEYFQYYILQQDPLKVNFLSKDNLYTRTKELLCREDFLNLTFLYDYDHFKKEASGTWIYSIARHFTAYIAATKNKEYLFNIFTVMAAKEELPLEELRSMVQAWTESVFTGENE